MRITIFILILAVIFSCGDGLSPEERLESANLSHVMSIASCDSLLADSIYFENFEILIDSTTRVPQTILESIQILDSTTNDYAKHMFAICPPNEYHFGFGRWMRTNWGLWANEALAQEIQQTFEIDHPDSMSGILLGLNSVCSSSDEKRITEFFEFYRSNLKDSTSYNRLNTLEVEIKKRKEANRVDG